MALPDRDIERLDHALDAYLHDREVYESDSQNELVITFRRLQAINEQVQSDVNLKSEVWRAMMSPTRASLTSSVKGSSIALASRSLRIDFVENEMRRGRKGMLFEAVLAVLLIFGTMAGAIAYRHYSDKPGNQTMMAPSVTEVPSDAPVAADCESTAHRTGTVEELAGTTPTIPPALPRYGHDPIFDETAGNSVSDGSQLIRNSVGINGSVDGVDDLMQQLVACRFFNGTSAGDRDVDGRYFALYSDDYFRRELAGYREAGEDIGLVSFWMPMKVPTVLETRLYGSRLLIVLQKATDRATSNPVLLLSWRGDAWQVDEVGTASMPDDWFALHPTSPPTVGEVMGNPRLDIAFYDSESPIKDSNGEYSCPAYEANGAPVPCGPAYMRLGPYLYDELPADTDFTICLSNIGTDSRRFVAADLGIDVQIAPGVSATFVVNVAAGDYPFEIYVGGSTEPDSTSNFTFTPADQPRGVG